MASSVAAAPPTTKGVAAAPRARLMETLGDWGPALPLLALLALLLIAPAVQLVVGSLSGPDGLTLAHWQRTFANLNDRAAIATSLTLAVLVASLSTLIGGPLAWLLSRMLPVSRAGWIALLNVAANFGGIGLGFAFLATLGTVGMVTLSVAALGLGWAPPSPASFTGLVLAYLYTNVPLFVLLTIPAMSVVRDDWWEAAQTASATRLRFWMEVGLPVLAPFLAAGWLLIFTWSVGIYGIAFALAGSGGATDVRLLTLQIGLILQSSVFGQERAYVLAVVLMAIATLALLGYRLLLRRAVRWL